MREFQGAQGSARRRARRTRKRYIKALGGPPPNEKEGIQADFKQIFGACFWGFWLVSVRIPI